jgi:hypothetical protein
MQKLNFNSMINMPKNQSQDSPEEIKTINTPLGYLPKFRVAQLVSQRVFSIRPEEDRARYGNYVLSEGYRKFAHDMDNARYTFSSNYMEYSLEMVVELALDGRYGGIELLLRPKKSSSKAMPRA